MFTKQWCSHSVNSMYIVHCWRLGDHFMSMLILLGPEVFLLELGCLVAGASVGMKICGFHSQQYSSDSCVPKNEFRGIVLQGTTSLMETGNNMEVSWNGGTPRSSIFVWDFLNYKPSIWRYPPLKETTPWGKKHRWFPWRLSRCLRWSMLRFPKPTPGWPASEWCWGWDSLDWPAWSWDLYWHRCRWFAAQLGMSVRHKIYSNVGNKVPNPQYEPCLFHVFFHCLYVCLQMFAELMSKGYNLVKLFNTLQWHQVTCVRDSEACSFCCCAGELAWKQSNSNSCKDL